MDTNYTIYCHRNKINNKAYIGQTGQIFNTAKEAALWANRDISSICRCCNGKTLSCGKHPKTGQPLHWKYLAEDLILYKNE